MTILRRIFAVLLFASVAVTPATAAQNTLITPGSPLTMAGLATFLNNALSTVATNYSGPTSPAVCVGGTACTYQYWMDTSASPRSLRVYDGAQWVLIGNLDTTAHTFGVIAPAGTLTGSTLAPNVLASSLTSVGTLTGGATGAGFTIALGSSTVTGQLSFTNLANGSALSVLGTVGNSVGPTASIAAAVDGQVMRRSGTSVGFGAVDLSVAAATTNQLPVIAGGTGAATAAAALSNLGGGQTYYPLNYLANGDFSQWALCPVFNCTVQIVDGALGTTAGYSVTPTGIYNLWPDSWYLGSGYGGTVTFSMQPFTDNQTTVPGYPQRFARGAWSVAPTLGSYTENPPAGTCAAPGGGTLTGCRNTYLDSSIVREYTSFAAGNTYTVSGYFRASTTNVFVAPILYYSLGYLNWVLGQQPALTGGYATYTATDGQFYVYQQTAGTTTGVSVTGVANNGSGLCRVQVASTSNFTTGRTGVVANIGGATACNGTYTITVVDGTHIDLQASSFSGAYTSDGNIGTPPTTPTIGASQSDGGVTWQNKGYAKGRTYELFEGSYTPGAVTSSGYNQGQVSSGSTGCDVGTSWTYCSVTIVLPPPEYNNTGDYAWSADAVRQLLPWNLTNIYFGQGNGAVVSFGVDIVGPLGAQNIDFAQIQVEPGVTATQFHKAPHLLQRLWSMDLENILGYLPNSPTQLTGFLTQTHYNSDSTAAVFQRRQFASSISGTSFANADGVSGNPTLQGTIGAPGGGTGFASYAVGDLLYADSTATLAKLASAATGNALISGGVGAGPAWGKIGLTTHISGVLPVANGGTNLASGTSGGILGYTAAGTLASSIALTANAIVLGGGAGATPAPMGSLGTTTTVLHGNAAGAPTFGAVSLTADVSGTLPAGNGGTGATAFTAGSVVFAGSSGVYTQDNANFFWDNTNKRLGIGTTSPGSDIHVLRSFAGQVGFTVRNSSTDAAANSAFGLYNNASGGLAALVASDAGGGLTTLLGTSSGGLTIYTNTTTSLSLGANNNNTRLVINSTGDVNIGLQQFNPSMASDTATADSTVCTATTGGKLLKGTGALGVCLGTSGRQFKTAFAPMAAGLDEIMNIHLLNYRYRKGYGDGGTNLQYGPTAQDVEAAIPGLARRDDKGDIINYDSGALFFIGLRAIQELKSENDNLRADIRKIKRRLAK